MGPRAFNRVCASIRINRDYDVVSVRINAHGVTKRAWAFNCETTVYVTRYAKTNHMLNLKKKFFSGISHYLYRTYNRYKFEMDILLFD